MYLHCSVFILFYYRSRTWVEEDQDYVAAEAEALQIEKLKGAKIAHTQFISYKFHSWLQQKDYFSTGLEVDRDIVIIQYSQEKYIISFSL
jgi:hypothetical protein